MIENDENEELFDDELMSERQEKYRSNTLELIKDSSHKIVDEIAHRVFRIDQLLTKIDLLLKKIQPPSSGRIRIVWQKPRGNSDRYVPVICKWTKSRSRWRYEVLKRPQLSVSGKGGFLTHRMETIKLIESAMSLINERQVALEYLSNLSRAWSQKSSRMSEAEPIVISDILDVIDRVNAIGQIQLSDDDIL